MLFCLALSIQQLPRPASRLMAVEPSTVFPEVRFSEVKTARGAKSDFASRAVRRLVGDLEVFDNQIGMRSKLRPLERWTLGISISTALYFGLYPGAFAKRLYRLVMPCCTAVVAAMGTAEEYEGQSNRANAHEISSIAVRAAAEAEEIFCGAERTKAVLPVCVVWSATAAALSVLSSQAIDVLFEEVSPSTLWLAAAATEPEFIQQAEKLGFDDDQLRNLILLIFPIAGILAASVASLAQIEVTNTCIKAVSLGRRRFATKRDVGRTWISKTELVQAAGKNQITTWLRFVAGLTPGPLVAALAGNVGLATKAVLASGTSAAQAAYYLAIAEYSLARGQESVAAKARTAAVSEAWAKQTMKANGRIPATSALAAFCIACTALAVETAPRILTMLFPLASSLVVIRAIRFRALTKGDADVASAAADQLAGLDDGSDDDPLLPLVLTYRNLVSALQATRDELRLLRRMTAMRLGSALRTVLPSADA